MKGRRQRTGLCFFPAPQPSCSRAVCRAAARLRRGASGGSPSPFLSRTETHTDRKKARCSRKRRQQSSLKAIRQKKIGSQKKLCFLREPIFLHDCGRGRFSAALFLILKTSSQTGAGSACGSATPSLFLCTAASFAARRVPVTPSSRGA